jgi:hypothetical protein
VTNFDVSRMACGARFRSRKVCRAHARRSAQDDWRDQLQVALHSDVMATITVAVVVEQLKI